MLGGLKKLRDVVRVFGILERSREYFYFYDVLSFGRDRYVLEKSFMVEESLRCINKS